LREQTDDDFRTDDGIQMQPTEIYSYLTRVMYNRRSKFDPLWNSLVIGGVGVDGEPFLVGAGDGGVGVGVGVGFGCGCVGVGVSVGVGVGVGVGAGVSVWVWVFLEWNGGRLLLTP